MIEYNDDDDMSPSFDLFLLPGSLTAAKDAREYREWFRLKNQIYGHFKNPSLSAELRIECLVELARHYNDKGFLRNYCRLFNSDLPYHFNSALIHYGNYYAGKKSLGFLNLEDEKLNQHFKNTPKAVKAIKAMLQDLTDIQRKHRKPPVFQ